MEWTPQTYRLDEVERKFGFPCVVCVNEGYYSETDAEGFSRGDIMSIDSKMVLHKVAANFSTDGEENEKLRETDYVELNSEILVPLNYKGKLKVLRHIKYYENVEALAIEFPKYAKVCENLEVVTEENVKVIIQCGTVIELDRIIPGSVHGTKREPDMLVIQFEHYGSILVVGVPFNAKGLFQTETDDSMYTIREAIDRYSLPQHVKFVDDAIKRVYTQDLLEGIENMKTITETLRLNRLVTQNVLVGHYKPLEETKTRESETLCQRTLLVLPMDNPDIRDIEVNVMRGVTDDIYETVFLVRNVSRSNTEEIVDGSLYVDFAMTPGVKRIMPEESQQDGTGCAEKPPRPPKPGHLASPVGISAEPGLEHSNQKKTNENSVADDDYLIPESHYETKKETKALLSLTIPAHDDVDEPGIDEITEDHPITPSSVQNVNAEEISVYILSFTNHRSMEWTSQTYRLDEVERKFGFPCVVCVNEGYYSETDAEGFSRGDIMSIYSKMVLHKVAANFSTDGEENEKLRETDYVELNSEVLVPLNYKGKLKVLRHIKYYENVEALAIEFPRYAKVCENLEVVTEENVKIIIQCGTVIELDRIIPGSVHGTKREPDMLVIQFEHYGSILVVGVPFNAKGLFQTETDDSMYTIREAIDRYSLPQHVKFVDDAIKRVYTQDLLAGIGNMKTITETLRLNRLVTQNVLVGHYKPLEETRPRELETLCQRTLLVLPMDNPDIRDIEVNVMRGVTDDIYETVFLVRNVSRSNIEEIVDGSLYVDFAMTPGVKRIMPEESQQDGTGCAEKPPPRPPKPGHLASPVESQQDGTGCAEKPPRPPKPGHLASPVVISAEPGLEHSNQKKTNENSVADDDYLIPESHYETKKETKALLSLTIPAHDDVDEPGIDEITEDHPITPSSETKKWNSRTIPGSVDTDKPGDYEVVENPVTPIPATEGGIGFSLADMDFNTKDSGKGVMRMKSFISNLKHTFSHGRKGTKGKLSTGPEKEKSGKGKHGDKSDERECFPRPSDDHYDQVNELEMVDYPLPINRSTSPQGHKKPIAKVLPSRTSPHGSRKLFKYLNTEELVHRLNICGLYEIVNMCSRERLNGAFFMGMTRESLQKDMGLRQIELIKLIKMRDENWVPT